ncbi:CehA/McbA family metallohydrolase [Verrucomicrobiaceae bacterium 227]
MTFFRKVRFVAMVGALVAGAARAEPVIPLVTEVAVQPLSLQVQRLGEALDYLGNPLTAEEKADLKKARITEDAAEARELIQRVLDPHCLAYVEVNPESRVKVLVGPAKPALVEQGWRQFLVKVDNQAGVTAALSITSPQAQAMANSPREELRDRWMDLQVYRNRPVNATLSGLELEYVILQVHSRDAGKRAGLLEFSVGQGTQDLGFRSDLLVTFDCEPAHEVKFKVLDELGNDTMASFEIRDRQGRVYPSMAKRLAPDFAFHPQIYRKSGETVRLPSGEYQIVSRRGPEYHWENLDLTVGEEPAKIEVALKRWIDPAATGWWSGDHHIHAAGCSHYSDPTEGVHAPDMMRHCLGEDLKVGANLTWGPCFDYQKQFFTGSEDKVSTYPYLLRYDVEVSGFGSHQSGHLCLLRLQNQMYPGGDSDKHWPTLCLNTLRWAQKQGAVCGPAHSGWGLLSHSKDLPNYTLPPFDGIGACEYIVDVTHEVEGPEGSLVPAVDFIAMVDTPYPWELNIWYHTLNTGYRTRISGETDFPCIYGERVGMGRSYVKVEGELTYDKWCEGIEHGRAYVSDGLSHLLDFEVDGIAISKESELKLGQAKTVTAKAKVAAMLPLEGKSLKDLDAGQRPYWHLERAREGQTRKVKVELIVNGYPVADQMIEADGTLRDLEFEVPIQQSSWVALRILPSSHTNPVFVMVDEKPVRASRRSAQWCLAAVKQCWKQKKGFIAPAEMDDAIAAYKHAEESYARILQESVSE